MTEQTALAEGEDCRFCLSKPGRRIMIEGNTALPPGTGIRQSRHFLVIPYRHFPDYFDIKDEEREELWRLVVEGKKLADEKHNPDGYNIGINVGKWAGQSIPHLHIHVIPRYKGDVENPKGGVRGVIPQTNSIRSIRTSPLIRNMVSRSRPKKTGEDQNPHRFSQYFPSLNGCARPCGLA